MPRVFVSVVVMLLAAACKPESPAEPTGPTPTPPSKLATKGRLDDLVRANSRFVGYLYSADQPSIIGAFKDGVLQWRNDPDNQSIVQGRADLFTWPDKTCVGFEQKNLFMPKPGPERFLVGEAVEPIKHRNNLPRSQDFSFQRGNLFLEYQPPQGTGYPQMYYLGEQK